MKKPILKSLILTCTLALPGVAMGGMGGGGSPCTLGLSWNSSYPLQFGSFVANTGGTVVVGTSADSASVTGGVIHMGGTVKRARFNLSCPGSMMTVGTNYIMSTDSSTTLTSGGNSMTVNNFTTSPSSGYISNNGSATIYVGGTLNASANQAAGNYSGSFNVTVNYN